MSSDENTLQAKALGWLCLAEIGVDVDWLVNDGVRTGTSAGPGYALGGLYAVDVVDSSELGPCGGRAGQIGLGGSPG